MKPSDCATYLLQTSTLALIVVGVTYWLKYSEKYATMSFSAGKVQWLCCIRNCLNLVVLALYVAFVEDTTARLITSFKLAVKAVQVWV